MPLNIATTRDRLQKFEFARLFIDELGWSNPKSRNPVKAQVKEAAFTRTPIAQLSGVIAFEVTTGDGIPDAKVRAAIQKQVTEEHVENLLIFLDDARTKSLWYWVKREAGKARARDHLYVKGQPGDLFISKLAAMFADMSEFDAEGNIPVTEVASRLKAAFDVERVTKKFYDQFKKEHTAFLGFIDGIPIKADAEWYASVMLNRMMFVYFIQRKGFLADDTNYLRHRLDLCQQEKGKDKFYSFYRYFLLRLFHEGFGQRPKQRAKDLEKLLGKIPYLNGGMFDIHELEKPDRYGKDIKIPDAAFERIFDYFDRYDWVLDPEHTVFHPGDKEEINPDVLGYIFEKYINQKQMGAYYTKEDITENIGKNTIIPFLFDAARKECSVAFENPNGPTVWDLLVKNPDRYIYAAIKKGVELPLPAKIEAGIKDVSRRDDWNKSAAGEFALPTEIWREVVARRQRYAALKSKIANREVVNINDLITLNLDIRRFALDVIENCEGTDLLRAFWQAIITITVLDLTCGSGAFIFAALNILEPLYEACLARMGEFLTDETLKHDAAQLKFTPHGFPLLPDDKFADFAQTLDRVADHPSPRYYIYKSIILQNLFGVDIMPEAVEICKLRLFLKLAAQVTPDAKKENLGIEPLPDIDFNICAGNTLVGYATLAEVQNSMFGRNYLERIQKADEQIRRFRKRQSQSGDLTEQREDKQQIRTLLNEIREKLDMSLFTDYGARELTAWKKSHQPFHWYVEFNSIIQSGGFDVIVGNPPYVEYKDVKGEYQIRNYKTETCSNLFVYVLERCTQLSRLGSEIGMIIPLSAFSTDRMIPLIAHLKNTSKKLSIAHFSWRPGKLFDGVNLQLSILLQKVGQKCQEIDTTRYLMWNSEARPELFSKIEYVRTNDSRLPGSIPKLGAPEAASILKRLRSHKKEMGGCFTRHSSNKVYYRRGGLYWKVFVDFVTGSSEEKIIHLLPEIDKYGIIAALSSGLWWWYFTITSDCRHLGNRDFETFPFDPREMSSSDQKTLSDLGKEYVKDLKRNAIDAVRVYKGKNSVDCLSFRVNQSKSIIDEIDRVLARHYGFTEEELDFIINYDIKYRLGRETETEEE